MNPTAASAASAAYQSDRRRSRTNLQVIYERPWEQNKRHFEQLRKPASAEQFRGPPWPPSQRESRLRKRNEPTPTQRLDSLLAEPLRRPAIQEFPSGSPFAESDASHQLATIPRHLQGRDAEVFQDRRLVKRKSIRQQLQRQTVPNQDRIFQSYQLSPSIPLPRNHVPPDLIEGARVLRTAGIELPIQGLQRSPPGPPLQQSQRAITGSAQSPERFVSSETNPVPGDLLESMGRLRFHEATVFGGPIDEHGATLPELPNSVVADVDGSNQEMPAFADQISEDYIPYSRIALAGLSGSGKAHCLRQFLARARKRAPSVDALEIDLSDPENIQLKHGCLPGLLTCENIDGVPALLQILGLPSVTVRVVVIESLNRPQDTDVVQNWYQKLFGNNCCVIITTRRLDIAKPFAAGDKGLITAPSAVSPWTASYLLSHPGTPSTAMDTVARQLSYHPAAILGAAKLMRQTGMPASGLSSYLASLQGDPSNPEHRTSMRLALESACGFTSPCNTQRPRPSLDKDAGAMFAILVHCVQRSWLDVFSEIHREYPAAMMLLGVLSALGRDEIEQTTMSKIQQIIGSNEAVQLLRNHCVVTLEHSKYRCPAPVFLAVRMWLVGRGELEDAFKLAAAVARI